MASFGLAVTMPLISSLSGFAVWGLREGIVAGLLTFAVFFTLGVFLLATAQMPSWVAVLSPFFFGLLYSTFNFIPLPLDDVTIATAGAIASFIIATVKYTDMPKSIIIPMGAAVVYTVVGDFIPTPVDDLLVNLIAGGTTLAMARSSSNQKTIETDQYQWSSE